MRFEASIPETLDLEARRHLLGHFWLGKSQEDLCFALWRPSTGASRTTGIITQLVLPAEGERHLHGNVSFEPRYLARVARKACQTQSGVAFMHSHPSQGWQSMSETDIVAERDRIAPPARAAGLPLLGLTVGTDGVWSARFWAWDGQQFSRTHCDKVRVVGSRIQISAKAVSPLVKRSKRLRRTIDTWGSECQAALASLRIGIVGLGSVGAIVAETMSRIGATDMLLVDADRVEEHNLDRLLYATTKNIGQFKVNMVAKRLRRSATAASFRVSAKRSWVQEQDGLSAILDCDVVFAAVDRPIPKDLLNNIAYVHCIPVIFGGVRVATKPNGRLCDAAWSVVRIGPGLRCLRCDGQYSSADVVSERDGSLDDPSYVVNNSALPGNENVFPFAANLASLMVMEMIRAMLHERWWPAVHNKVHFSFVPNRMTSKFNSCHPNCSIALRIGQGNSWAYPYLDASIARRSRIVSALFELFSKVRNRFGG